MTKCNKILNKFVYPYKEESPGILCFQEIKLNCSMAKQFISKFPSYWLVASVNPGIDQSTEGVFLAIHKLLNVTILDKKVEKGWLILVKCRILDKVCVIIKSVYMPSRHTTDSYSEKLRIIESHLQYFKCDNVILQGDFNIDFDRYEGKKGSSIALEQFLGKWDLQDAWRIQNPMSDRRTCHSSHGISRHLDYCFISLNFMCYLSSCSIGNSYCSDHSPVVSKFQFNTEGGKRQFIFPVDLCYSDQFKVQLSENIQMVKKENFGQTLILYGK